MKRALLISVGLALFISRESSANICRANRDVSKGGPFEFTSALVESFGWAEVGLSRIPEDPTPGDTGTAAIASALANTTTTLVLINEDYRCAAEAVKAYQESKDRIISMAAKGAFAAYTLLMRSNLELIEENRQLLERRMSLNPATQATHLANIQIQADNGWQMLMTVSEATTMVLVQIPKGEKDHLSTLTITAEQRKRLLAVIESHFPKIKNGLNADQHGNVTGLEGAVYVLHHFLSEPAWKTSNMESIMFPPERLTPNVNLPRSGEASGLPISWKSLATTNRFQVTLQGADDLYVEERLHERQQQEGRRLHYFKRAELRRQGDHYSGVTRWGFICEVPGRNNQCNFEMPIEVSLLTPTRIDGRSEGWPADTKFDCRTCTYLAPRVWHNFTLVPE